MSEKITASEDKTATGSDHHDAAARMDSISAAEMQQTEIDRDNLDLMQFTGHKPVFERNYSKFALLAYSFIIVDSWSGIIGSLATGISSGGTVMLIYGSIAMTIFTMAVALSLAEMSGAYPTSGGQYHWTAELAPKRWSPFLSWFCGYFNVAGWCIVCASVCLIVGQFLMAMIILCNPDITYKRWQGFVVYHIANIVITLLNIFGRRILPLLHKGGFIICMVSFFVVNITILATAKEKRSASFVFATFTNNTGWKEDAIAFIVGLTNPAFAYGGLDGAIHMAEEMKDARKNMPFVLVNTIVIGFITLIVTAIAICFCMLDLSVIVSTPTGVPILQVFYEATRNKGAAVFLLSLLFYLTAASCVGAQQTSNRLIWAFARDNALPYSRQFNKIHPTLQVPVNAALLTGTVVAVLGCIYVGSSTAFNALVGCNALLANISFTFPIGLLIFGRRKHMKPTTFPLGNVWGPIINIVAFGYIVFIVIMFCFPFTYPVAADNMNYSCVIIGAVGIFSGLYWMTTGRKTYNGPIMDVGIEAAFLQQLQETTAHKQQ